jgi:hypothetical protein
MVIKAHATAAPAAAELINEPASVGSSGGPDGEDLAALRAAIEESEAQYQRGEFYPLEDVLAELDEEDQRAGL